MTSLKGVVDATAKLSTAFTGMNETNDKTKESTKNLGGAFSSVIGTVGMVASALGGAFSSVIGTVGMVASALGGLVETSKKYVEAFSPASMLVFNQAIRDMSATIGVALTPVINAATNIIKEFSSRLLPIAESLQGTIEIISSGLSAVLITVMDAIGKYINAIKSSLGATDGIWAVFDILIDVISTLTSAIADFAAGWVSMLIPVVKALGAALSLLLIPLQWFADAMRVAGVMFSAIATVISKFVSSLLPAFDLKNTMSQLREGFQMLLRAAVVLVAQFLKMAGKFGDDIITEAIKGFSGGDAIEKKDATGLAAMQNARFSGFSDFGKQLALDASIAQGTGDDEQPAKTDDWLKLIAGDLKEIQKGEKPKWFEDLKIAIRDAVAEGIKAPVYNAGKSVLGAVSSLPETVWDAITGQESTSVMGSFGR